MKLVTNLTERENLQNSDCLFRFLFSGNVYASYGAKQVYKPLLGSFVVTCRLARSEIPL